jgi:endonuclease/exonuclease/phosphatase family metal-dependent hydrolase
MRAGVLRTMRRSVLGLAFGALSCSSDPAASIPSQQDASTDAAPETSTDALESADGHAAFDAAPVNEAGDAEAEAAPDVSPDASPATFGLLTLNLHCFKTEGTTYPDNAARWAAIASTVAAEDISVITVQEACVRGAEDAIESLRVAIEAATQQAWSKTWAPSHIAWQGTVDEAQEGQGILFRGALSDPQVIEYHHQAGLKRIAVGAKLDAQHGNVQLWSLHLEVADAAIRLAQARETASLTLSSADPSLQVMVAGDCNDVSGSAPVGALESYGFNEVSKSLGAEVIDHVFAHDGAAIEVIEARKVFDGQSQPAVSDHPGVLLRWRPAAAKPVVVTRVITTSAVQGWAAVRGSAAPLDWGWGWPAWQRPDQSWLLVVTSLPASTTFEYKWLSTDTTWQTGANATGTSGQDNESAPSF